MDIFWSTGEFINSITKYLSISEVTSIIIAMCTVFSAVYLIKSAKNNNETAEKAFQKLNGFADLFTRLNKNDLMMKEKSISLSIKPYFMSLCCQFVKRNDGKVVTISFQNKGNGPAYNIALNEVRNPNAAEYGSIRQIDPIKYTAVLVDEACDIVLYMGKGNTSDGVYIKLTLTFYDIQGKQYKEDFELVIHEEGIVHNIKGPFVMECEEDSKGDF